MATETRATRLLKHVQNRGIVRPRDLDEIGIPRAVLKRLVDRGELVRRSRGVYITPSMSRPATRIWRRFACVAQAPRSV